MKSPSKPTSTEHRHLLEQLQQIARGLGETFAPFCEVVVHDLTDRRHAVLAIHNNLSGRGVGEPVTELGAQRPVRGGAHGLRTDLGVLLLDRFGWQAIFYVNLPVGVIGFVLAAMLVPRLETHPHKFDVAGIVISAVGLFLLVFGLQEGEKYDWGVIWGPISVWSLIIAGVVVLALFVWQQSRTRAEALVPLELFRDRNFSTSNVAIAAIGCSITAMSLPMMFFFQLARGLTPTQAALLTVPTAVLSGVLSPLAGMLLVRVDPRVLLVPSLLLVGGGQFWYAAMMNGTTDVLMFLWPAALIGLGSAGMWGPLATTATLDLPPRQAGAASGIYNTTRTIGSVLGSAGIAALMQARLEANLGGAASGSASGLGTGQLPAAIVEPFSSAMGQSMLLSVAAMAVGLVMALFLRRSKATSSMPRRAAEPERHGV